MARTDTIVFDDRLRAARTLRDLSQAELSKLSGIQSSAIAHFEGGSRRPSLENFIKLVEALEVSADYLIGRTKDIAAAPSADPIVAALAKVSTRDRDLALKLLKVLANR